MILLCIFIISNSSENIQFMGKNEFYSAGGIVSRFGLKCLQSVKFIVLPQDSCDQFSINFMQLSIHSHCLTIAAHKTNDLTKYA